MKVSLPRRVLILAGGMAALASMALMPGSAFAGVQDFDIVNNTSDNLQNVYVSPSSVDSWLNDVLGAQVMPSGAQAHVTFGAADPSVCVYDVKIVDDAGNTGTISGIDLCSTSTVTFTGAAGNWAFKLS